MYICICTCVERQRQRERERERERARESEKEGLQDVWLVTFWMSCSKPPSTAKLTEGQGRELRV